MVGFKAVRFGAGLALVVLASGCDMLGIETPAKQQAAMEADGKAVGSACRHAGRAIEDCFMLNPKANKAAVFAGWKEMNDYMTKNKIEVVTPQMARGGAKDKEPAATPAPTASAHEEAPAADKAATHAAPAAEKAKPAGKAAAQTPAPVAANTSDPNKVAPIAESSVTAARARAHMP